MARKWQVNGLDPTDNRVFQLMLTERELEVKQKDFQLAKKTVTQLRALVHIMVHCKLINKKKNKWNPPFYVPFFVMIISACGLPNILPDIYPTIKEIT